MIDNLAILLFSVLIVYTIFRAIRLDKILPWFSGLEEKPPSLSRKEERR